MFQELTGVHSQPNVLEKVVSRVMGVALRMATSTRTSLSGRNTVALLTAWNLRRFTKALATSGKC